MTELFSIAIENPVVECGGVVRGTVDWDTAAPPRSVRIRAAYASGGDGGGADDGGGEAATFEGTAGHAEFAVVVPTAGPMSYEGETVRVQWTIEVRADIKRERDPIESAEITVLPRGGLGLWARETAPPPHADT